MGPRLSGFRNFAIGPQGASIGRDASNDIEINDPLVSLQHCRIECENGRFAIVDIASTNGTFVNEKAVERSVLAHGDRILLGGTAFQFVDDSVEGSPTRAEFELTEFDAKRLLQTETFELDPSALPFYRAQTPSDEAEFRRLAHDMGILLKLSAEIASIENSDTLQEVLLARIFDVVPAECGVILHATEDGRFLSSPVFRRATPGDIRIRVSRTVTERVLTSGESVLRNDLFGDPESPHSVVSEGILSILCVPLTVMGNRLGVLYLDTTNERAMFDERHLQLVSAMASIGAVSHEHLRYVEWLEAENEQLTHEVSFRHDMIGQSAVIKDVLGRLSLISATDDPVLILGETGTGKELAARAIHKNSARRNGPFVVVNCGAVAKTLWESSLFGHVKGAFTGAERDRRGFFSEADGGTLFLDEIGELPLEAQAALLRIIEDGEVMRVGSTKPTHVNVRLVSATNRDIRAEIAAGRFKPDLDFRLGFKISLPPLRDRRGDIPLLVDFFIEKNRQRTERKLGPVPMETMQLLQNCHWAGNIRQLESAIRYAIVVGKSSSIRADDLPREIFEPEKPSNKQTAENWEEAGRNHKSMLILKALQTTDGVVSKAADLLGLAPTYLQRLITFYGLRDALNDIRRNAG